MFGFRCEHPAGSEGGGGSGGDAIVGQLPEPAVTMPADEDRGEAVFAGGCFWCVEAVFQRLAGVREVAPGYAGGNAETADYQSVSTGTTGHAEVVRVRYDPGQVRYDQLLHVFFATHEPTEKNRQGPDVGPMYRSAVFFADEHQKQVTEAYIGQLNASGAFADPIVTTLEPLEGFHPAESYHQQFVPRHPRHPYVQRWVVPKLRKLDAHFADKVRAQA